MRGPRSSRIGNARLERAGRALERRGFDTISATRYTFKDGREYASIVVLAEKGRFKEFEKLMDKKQELYSIFFRIPDKDFPVFKKQGEEEDSSEDQQVEKKDSSEKRSMLEKSEDLIITAIVVVIGLLTILIVWVFYRKSRRP